LQKNPERYRGNEIRGLILITNISNNEQRKSSYLSLTNNKYININNIGKLIKLKINL